MIIYNKIKRMEKNRMKETKRAITHIHTHYTFSETKINSNALLKIGEFLSSYKNKKAEVL